MKLHLYLFSILLLIPHQIFCKEKQQKKVSVGRQVIRTLPWTIPMLLTAGVAWKLSKLTKRVDSLAAAVSIGGKPVESRRGSFSSSPVDTPREEEANTKPTQVSELLSPDDREALTEFVRQAEPTLSASGNDGL